MNREQLRKKICGTPVTLPTPFDKDMKVDFPKLADMTQWWVEQGLGTEKTALKTCAAMGEGPDLSDDEWPHILRTVVNTAGPDKTIICGLKPKNTLHTIEDAKRAQDLGAVGLQIDLPFFKLLPLLEQGKYNEAEAEQRRVEGALAPWMAKTVSVSGGYRQCKAMLAAVGRSVGPPRPPTLRCSDEEISEVRGIMAGLGWVKDAQTAAAD